MATRKPYPSDVSDEEWAFVAPYLALVREDAPQRNHDLREVLNGLRWIVRTGSAWRYMPHDLPPWEAVYQQTQRWIKAGVFEEMVHDLRVLLRLSKDRASEPTAAILDSRTLRSTPESGSRGGYDGHKRKKGSKVHAAVDTLGHLLALRVSPANEDDRKQVERALRGDPASDRGERGVGLRRSRIHGREGLRGCRRARHPTRSGQAGGGQARLRALAEAMGGGTRFRMGDALSAFGEGLREAARDGGGAPLRRVRLPLPPAGGRHPPHRFITRSRVLMKPEGSEVMQDRECGRPRTPRPRRWVNRGTWTVIGSSLWRETKYEGITAKI